MKNFYPACFLLLLLPLAARADAVHGKAVAQMIETYARLDATFRAASAGKSQAKDFETDLAAGKVELLAAAQGGVAEDFSARLAACAAVLDAAGQAVSKVTGAEAQKVFHGQEALGDLMRLTGKLAETMGSLARLSLAERKELGQKVEARFGQKVMEFPRGDTAPFASGSRSPFASSMWILNLQFDVAVFAKSKTGV